MEVRGFRGLCGIGALERPSILFTVRAFHERLSICACFFLFDGWMQGVTVLVPRHCLSFYFFIVPGYLKKLNCNI